MQHTRNRLDPYRANLFFFLNVEKRPVFEHNSITWDCKRRNSFWSNVQILSVSGTQRCAVVRTVFAVTCKRIKPDLTLVYIYTVNFVFPTQLASWLRVLFACIYFSFVARIRVSRYICPWYILTFYLITPAIPEQFKDQTDGICQTLVHIKRVVGKECVELHNAARDTRSGPRYGWFLLTIKLHNIMWIRKTN